MTAPGHLVGNIPYGRQSIDESDIQAVTEVLRSAWLTQGPKVQEFEETIARFCQARYAVVFSNGTSALQAAYSAAGIKAGDEIVTSPLTFAATATAAVWLGARPVFADVDSQTGNLDPEAAERAISARTRALVPVDFTGRPASLQLFKKLARDHGLVLIEDACHALGAHYEGKRVGSISDLTVFSFHPVKSITTGEGGAVLTKDKSLYEHLQRFRHHGIEKGRDWECSVEEMGVNGRLTDFQCALGLSQLKKLDRFIQRRREIAQGYQEAFKDWEELELFPLDMDSSYHLYVVKLRSSLAKKRREIFRALRSRGIGVQIHYIPVYMHPLYQAMGYSSVRCIHAEDIYKRCLSLPIFPDLTKHQQEYVIRTLRSILDSFYAGCHRS